MWRILSGLFLGWSLGANDSANVFGTGVTTGIIRYRTAIWLTAAFVLLGAMLEGAKCMKIVGELSLLSPMDAFFCALAAAITMSFLTFLGIPASTSQAIIGAVIGVGIISESADFSKLYKVVSCWIFTPVCGLAAGYILHRVLGYVFDRTIKSLARRSMLYSLGILAAGCYGAYTLGSNNVANVTGVYVGSGVLTPDQAALIGALSIAVGVLTYSKKVMTTIGKGIVPLDPFSALVVVLAGALTLHLFTQIGVPVSSSQAVVGAVVGVGFVGGVQTVSFRMVRKIGVGWLMTPVSGGLLAYGFITLFS
jgi:inorganic phosphate transporter, PiT family